MLIDQKGLINFQQRFIKTTTFPTLYGLERGLVVHLVVGIHVADVVVDDQVHVTKLFNSTNVAFTTWRHVRVLSNYEI